MAHIVGTAGDDERTGTPDNDIIEGLEGNDRLDGGSGDDILYGGTGADTLYDGPGSDLAVLGAGSGLIYADSTDASGFDTYRGDSDGYDLPSVLYTTATQRIVVTLRAGLATGAEIGTDRLIGIKSVVGGAGDDIFRGDDSDVNGFYGGAGNDFAKGYGGFDWLDGDAGDDKLYGGDGDDWLFGTDGADYLVGGDGNDRINFMRGPIESGPDIVKGGAGDDWICGSAGSDKLFGGDGSDLLEGGEGADALYGGAGVDVFNLTGRDAWSQRAIIGDFVDGFDKLFVYSFERAGFIAHAHDSSVGLVVDYGFGPTLLIRGFTLAQLDLTDFV